MKSITAKELGRILNENKQPSAFSATDRHKLQHAIASGKDFVICAEYLPPTREAGLDYSAGPLGSIEPLSSRFRFRVCRAKINAGISHLTKGKGAALKHAHTAAGTTTRQQFWADEFLRREIPEWRLVE
jgi:hypothetical protein